MKSKNVSERGKYRVFFFINLSFNNMVDCDLKEIEKIFFNAGSLEEQSMIVIVKKYIEPGNEDFKKELKILAHKLPAGKWEGTQTNVFE